MFTLFFMNGMIDLQALLGNKMISRGINVPPLRGFPQQQIPPTMTGFPGQMQRGIQTGFPLRGIPSTPMTGFPNLGPVPGLTLTSQPNEENINKKAIKHFGTTRNFDEAGYVLKDGTILDLSGKRQGGQEGVRSLDHREINFAYEDVNIAKKYPELVRNSSNSVSMIDYINRGNIRVQQEGIDLSKSPTSKQISFIKDHIVRNKGGSYFVDVQDKQGNTLKSFSYEYPNVKVSTIMNDIKDYFSKPKKKSHYNKDWPK